MVQEVYVYLVHRDIKCTPIRCTDLVCKVGMGSGERKNKYRTPYGDENLLVHTWPCQSRENALEIEGHVLDLLELRGWLRYHKSGKRAEVVSFPFSASSQVKMISEYTKNIKWIHSLISSVHSSQNLSERIEKCSLLLRRYTRSTNSITMHVNEVPKLNITNTSCTSRSISYLFNSKCKIKRKGDSVLILIY